MEKTKLDKNIVIRKAAEIVNKMGVEQITLKMLANDLGVKSPSLYNHIKGLDDLKKQLMIYGWKQMEERIIQSVIGISGYDAIKAMCYAFYDYATENAGIFNAMLWYNKFQDEEMAEATSGLFSILLKLTASLNFPEEYCLHLIRTFRAFLEGFFLLVNNGSFGHPLPIRDSFELSLNVLMEGIKTLEQKPYGKEGHYKTYEIQ